DLIDFGNFNQQLVLLAFGQAARHDDRAESALAFEVEHLANDGEGFLPGRLYETARIDDDNIRPIRLRGQGVPILSALAQHALAVHEVLGAAEADEGEGLFGHEKFRETRAMAILGYSGATARASSYGVWLLAASRPFPTCTTRFQLLAAIFPGRS